MVTITTSVAKGKINFSDLKKASAPVTSTGGSVPISFKEKQTVTPKTSTGGAVPINIKEPNIPTAVQPTPITPSPISPAMFDKMSPAEQDRIIQETYGTDKTTQVYRAYTGNIGGIPHPKLQYQPERIKQYFNSRGIYRDNLTEAEIRGALRYLLYEDAVDPVGAQERARSSLSPIELTTSDTGKLFAKMGVGVLNFPEFLVEEVGGRGYNAIVSGGKQLNKPITPPSWSPRGYYEKEITPTLVSSPGGVSAVFGAGTREFEKRTGAWTPEKEAQYQFDIETMRKNPGSVIFGTFGELLGAKGATTSIQIGKTYVSKGTSGLIKATTGKDIAASALKPTNVVREATSRIRQGLGLEKEIKTESYFSKPALEGKTTYGQTTFKKGIEAFKETKKTGLRPKEYTVSHTAPSPLELVTGRVKIKGSTSESPALSTSPFGRAVPQFLKVEPNETYTYRYSILPKMNKPTSPTIFLKDIYRLPKEVRESYERSASYMKEQPRGSYGVIATKAEMGRGGLVEPETLIWKGTKLVRTKKNIEIPENIIKQRKVYIDLGKGKTPRLSTTYKGVRVPVPIYEATGEGIPKGAISIGGKIKTGISKAVYESPEYASRSVIGSGITLYAGSRSSYKFRPSKPAYSFSSSASKTRTSYRSSSSYTSKPSYPSTPSYPSYPSTPSVPSYPSTPSYRSKPSRPSYPSLSKGSYTSKPSYTYYPSKSSKASYSKPIYYMPSKKTTTILTKKKYKISDIEKYRERNFYIRPIYGGSFSFNPKGGKK